MAAFNFPASPALNDTYTANSVTFKWNGTQWTRVGDPGAQGAQGYQGYQGAVGAQGTQGAPGAQGDVGAQGTQGAVGAQGTQGAPGAQGNQGYQGRQGTVGAQGTQGAPGSPGAQGAQGSPGAQGAQGAQGVQGASGPTAQIAKAWVNFNGQSTVAIRDDYNVNTITDLGTGEYRVNWSTSFANANYCVVTGNSIQADSSTMSLYNNRWSGSSIEPNYTGYIECSARESSANQVKDIDYGYLVAYDN